jgi:uncharacterized protein (DUF2141 family)
MNRYSRLTPFLVFATLALLISACQPTVTTGSEQIFPLDVPSSEANIPTEITLQLAAGAGALALHGGAASLMQGDITYNATEYEPEITNGEGAVLVSQKGPRGLFLKGNPDLINSWDLKLGEEPMSLMISLDTGNYTVEFAESLPANLNVELKADVGNVDLVFARGLTAQVILGEGGNLKVKAQGDWTKSGNAYMLGAGTTGITITVVEMTIGNLTLNSK